MKEELRALATAALTGKMARTTVTGATKSGRTKVEFLGTAGEAETEWFTLLALLKLCRMARA